MTMTLQQVQTVIGRASAKLPAAKRSSYSWLVTQAIKEDASIIDPQNFVSLNEHLRTLSSLDDPDETLYVANDFLYAIKEVPAKHINHYLMFMLAQKEIREDNILSSTEVEDNSDSDELENSLSAYNDVRATNQQSYAEFFTHHFCKIISLIHQGQLNYTTENIEELILNADDHSIIEVWQQEEFSHIMEAIPVAWRILILDKIQQKLQINNLRHLLNIPNAKGDYLFHAAARLPDDSHGYDMRFTLNRPADHALQSTTCVVLGDVEIPDEKDHLQKRRGIKQIVQYDEKGNVHEFKINAMEIRNLADILKIHEAPLNRVNATRNESFRLKIKFESLVELDRFVTSRGGHTHFTGLTDKIVARAEFSQNIYWNLNQDQETALKVAAKHGSSPSITPFIVAKNNIVTNTQYQIERADRQHHVSVNNRAALPQNYWGLSREEHEALNARIAAERKEDKDYITRHEAAVQKQREELVFLNNEMSQAALFAAREAKSDKDWQTVIHLLDNGAEAGIFDGTSPYSVLHYAVMGNRMDLVTRLINERSPNLRNPLANPAYTPLMCAALSPDTTLDTFQALMHLPGVDINAENAGESALHIASRTGQTNKVLALLSNERIVTQALAQGLSPIALSEENHHEETTNALKLDTLFAQIYDGDFHQTFDTSFMRSVTQDEVNQAQRHLINRRHPVNAQNLDRSVFFITECLDHYRPAAQNPLLPVAQVPPLSFARDQFTHSANLMNSLFSLVRRSNDNDKYDWLGTLRTKALTQLNQDIAALGNQPELIRERLIEARNAGIFSRHRSTCCLFRVGRTDTQIDLDNRIRTINLQLGYLASDHSPRRNNNR